MPSSSVAHCAHTISVFLNKTLSKPLDKLRRQSFVVYGEEEEEEEGRCCNIEMELLVVPQWNKWNKKSGGLENCKTSYSASLPSLYSSGMTKSNCCFLNPKKIKYQREHRPKTWIRYMVLSAAIHHLGRSRFNILTSLWFQAKRTTIKRSIRIWEAVFVGLSLF